MNQPRGTGSLRQRRPDVWEIRVSLGPDPVAGRSRIRSVTIAGDRRDAEAARARYAEAAALTRCQHRAQPGIPVGQLLHRWLDADHGWRPSTLTGYRSTVRALTGDPIAARRASGLTPRVMRAAMSQWRRAGLREPTISGRVRCLRSALGWAHAEGILDHFPLEGMRGPSAAAVRTHAPVEHVRAILRFAEHAVRVRRARDTGAHMSPGDTARLHRAEQVLLLARLAADTGARRGELAALQVGDLDGDALTIARGTSAEIVGPTKSGRVRRLTLGPTTARLWRSSTSEWKSRNGDRPFGPWLFSADADHAVRLTTSGLGHWFTDLTRDTGYPDVTLHRLRHTVATTLVSRGDILQAQYRLGHRDASTTLRIYSHALPLRDAAAAATLERLYR
jgi:integrase